MESLFQSVIKMLLYFYIAEGKKDSLRQDSIKSPPNHCRKIHTLFMVLGLCMDIPAMPSWFKNLSCAFPSFLPAFSNSYVLCTPSGEARIPIRQFFLRDFWQLRLHCCCSASMLSARLSLFWQQGLLPVVSKCFGFIGYLLFKCKGKTQYIGIQVGTLGIMPIPDFQCTQMCIK